MLQIRDERDTVWFIDKEDPAGPLCRSLEKAGFESVVLPRQAILTGEVPTEAPVIETAMAGLSLVDSVSATVRKQLIRKAEHQARVFLCWRHLIHDKTLPQ